MEFGIEGIKESAKSGPILKVVGVGGGGGNAVNRMISSGIRSVDFIVANTDLQDLKSSLASHKLQLGSKCTRGLGAGAKPDVGREAAMEDLEAIREFVSGADMVFITAGLGGGTGTGGAPVIAEIAREMGCLTVGVVTKPFKFEGKVRSRNAEEGILNLRKHVDTLIVIPNDNLLMLANKKTSIVEAFSMADDVLRVAIQGISDLVHDEGMINLDFADVSTVMTNMGQAIMGTGLGSGENKALDAAEKAIHSPLLDDCRIDGAKGILIHVSGPNSLTVHEVNEAASFITDHADDDAYIIFGATIDEEMPEDQIEITVIATGFNGAPLRERPREETARDTPAGRFSSFGVYSSTSNAPFTPPGLEEAEAAAAQAQPTTMAPPMDDEADLVSQSLAAEPAEEEDVMELKDPIMDQVETRPNIPPGFVPDNSGKIHHGGNIKTDLDIPAYIRERYKRFSDD